MYSVKTKNDEKVFVYTLIESQSAVDYWISLRLLEYTLLLCKRHKSKTNKLPLVYTLVIYNGKDVYTAPRNLWELFEDSSLAKKLIDKERGYIYIKSFLQYTNAKLTEQKPKLEKILTRHLSLEKKDNIMRTIAQKYIDEGRAEGEAKLIRIMLQNGNSIE